MFLFLFRPDMELNERTSAFIHYSLKAKKQNKKVQKTFISYNLFSWYVFLVHFNCNILLCLYSL